MGLNRAFGQNDRWVATGEALAEGGQAHIHVVIDSTGQRQGEFVIKLLKNITRTPRLDREIETTKRLYALGCPVLEIADDYITSNPDARRPWYVAPRLVRGAIARHLRSGEHYGGTFESAIELYRKILVGVLAIHAQKVAHRDLKPENILLSGDGVVLADLGLALALGEIEGERLTAELERIGSLHYTPPEAFSRRPVNPEQFAFDAFAMGKILYEVLAGIPLPAFVSPTDPEYDLTKKWDGSTYRAVNRVLRGLLNDEPAVRVTYLGELPGQIDELLALHSARETVPATLPRWHNDLLLASDLLASSTSMSAAMVSDAAIGDEAEQIAKEVLDVWQSNGAVKLLDEALGAARGGRLVISPPALGEVARSQLGGLQATRRGLEPLEDGGYPFRPKAEAGVHMSVGPAVSSAVPFRQMWLCSSIGIKDGVTAVAAFIIRRESGIGGPTDIVGNKVLIKISPKVDTALIAKVRRDAEAILLAYVQDVISEVRRVAVK